MTKHEAIKLGRMRCHDDRHQFIAWLEERLRKLYKENINLNKNNGTYNRSRI